MEVFFMNIKYLIIIAAIIYIFIFPPKAKAEKINIYHLRNDNVYIYNDIIKTNFDISENKNTSKKAFIVLDKLFNNIQNINYVTINI